MAPTQIGAPPPPSCSIDNSDVATARRLSGISLVAGDVGNSNLITAFGAIAELIDNAADPDVAAKRLQITAESMPDGKPALIITDDGNGLDLAGLQKLLSFGYNDKAERFKGTIGRYGNGFKTSSMRLAARPSTTTILG